MKRIFLIFLLLIIAVPCLAGQPLKRHLEPETVNYFSLPSSSGDQFTLNEQIKLIKYNGGSVTLSGLVANFSNVAGFQFVTNPSVDLRKWIGYYITFTSTAGNTLKVKVSAAGTGETLGDEIMRDPTFIDQTKWSVVEAGWSVSGGVATATAGTASYLYDVVAVNLKLILSSRTVATRTAGSVAISIGGYWFDWSSKTGTRVAYGTAGGNNFGLRKDASFAGTLTAISAKQVLTPSALGVYFTDPQVVGTFNYNAASYTAVITKD